MGRKELWVNAVAHRQENMNRSASLTFQKYQYYSKKILKLLKFNRHGVKFLVV